MGKKEQRVSISWRLVAQAEEVQDFAALLQALGSCRDGAHNDLSDGLNAATALVKCLEIHGVLVEDEHRSVAQSVRHQFPDIL